LPGTSPHAVLKTDMTIQRTEITMMKKMASLIALLCCSLPVFAADLPVEARIEQAMLGAHRSDANLARNRFRHPVGTLSFFGLKDGMSVLEILPGAGWYTEIIAPVMRDRGSYAVASYDPDVAGQPEYRYGLHRQLLDKLAADPALYDQVAVVPFSPPESGSLGENASYDLILTFRNTHGWISDGIAAQVFAEFARVLKPGGVLGVVQHRANQGTDPKVTAKDGYVSEDAVVALARDAGLYLEGRSEVNANPADTRDHAGGVWNLPPGFAACRDLSDQQEKADCEKPWLAMGESDRMTLRFRKPLE
jgi:predicted methyltransferase